ncbi:WhiB family transcriptional regulator [Streptomyces canus]|uniref:WhiB family transcriptional regulator n=1 Tax=Streptomyces canus TaxID=58343 RepID=UPI00369727B3
MRHAPPARGTGTGAAGRAEQEGSRVWESAAACLQQDADIWFSRRSWDRARAICAACPVLDDCRAAVLRREKGLPKCRRSGVIAGLTGPQRHDLERLEERRGQAGHPPRTRPEAVPRKGPAPCGTRAAYQRHLRRGEPVDEACRHANARDVGRYRRTGSTRARSEGTPPRDRPPQSPAARPSAPDPSRPIRLPT